MTEQLPMIRELWKAFAYLREDSFASFGPKPRYTCRLHREPCYLSSG